MIWSRPVSRLTVHAIAWLEFQLSWYVSSRFVCPPCHYQSLENFTSKLCLSSNCMHLLRAGFFKSSQSMQSVHCKLHEPLKVQTQHIIQANWGLKCCKQWFTSGWRADMHERPATQHHWSHPCMHSRPSLYAFGNSLRKCRRSSPLHCPTERLWTLDAR